MVTCDYFELTLDVLSENAETFLKYCLLTDLPAGSAAILSCERSYLNWRDEECVWIGYNERLIVLPNILGDFSGLTGIINVNEVDANALRRFEEINGGGFSAGIKSPVSDLFTVKLVVGARQKLREFGRNNCNLSGKMVSGSGDINVIEIRKSVVIPMRQILQPIVD